MARSTVGVRIGMVSSALLVTIFLCPPKFQASQTSSKLLQATITLLPLTLMDVFSQQVKRRRVCLVEWLVLLISSSRLRTCQHRAESSLFMLDTMFLSSSMRTVLCIPLVIRIWAPNLLTQTSRLLSQRSEDLSRKSFVVWTMLHVSHKRVSSTPGATIPSNKVALRAPARA